MKRLIQCALATLLFAHTTILFGQCPVDHEVDYLSDNLIINGSFENSNNDFDSDFTFRSNCSPRQRNYSFTSLASNCHASFDNNLTASNGDQFFTIDFPPNGNNQNIWCQAVAISGSSTYEFAGDFANLARAIYSGRPNPAFNIVIRGNESIFRSTDNFDLIEGEGWNSISTTFDSNNDTEIEICIQNTVVGGNGRDMGIDNLSLKQFECREVIVDAPDESDDKDIDFLDCDELVGTHSASVLNGSFEEGSFFINEDESINLDQSQIDSWSTAALDNNIQITDSGHNGVDAYEGTTYTRANALTVSSIYQDITTIPGDIIHYTFAHRGGEGIDEIAVYLGTPKPTGQEPFSSELVNSFETNNDRWVIYEGFYEVPPGQLITRFSLGALNSSNGNLIDGNLIDAVTVQSAQASCEAPLRGNVEICDNGVDDDNDGLIDDQDPDCSTSGGNNGGLESNGRLAGKIFQRSLERRIEPSIAKTHKSQMAKIDKTSLYGLFGNTNERSVIGIDEFIPIDTIENTETFISSPTDLVNITNATEVFSVDIFRENNRLGAIFATTTQGSVYEHTKFICDRLKGGVINNLKTEKLGIADFVVADIIHPEGNREYAISFSARENENGQFDIQSHWSLENYPKEESYYNFQIWASDMQDLKKLTLKTLQLLNEYKIIATMTTTKAPSVFVSSGEYLNGELNLKLINKTGSKNITIQGMKTTTETTPAEEVFINTPIKGAYSEFITVDVGAVYDMGFRISHLNDTIFDDLFIADGLWFIDTQEDNIQYEISAAVTKDIKNIHPLERSISVNGNISNNLNIYRTFKPDFGKLNLSEFNTLHFDLEGIQALQIVLIKESISEWDAQYKTSYTTSGKSNEVDIPINRFSNGSGEAISLEDIQAVIFRIENGGETREVNIEISNLEFRNQEDSQVINTDANSTITVSPNPSLRDMNVNWLSEAEGIYNAVLSDLNGLVIKDFRGLTSVGHNQIVLERNNLSQGIYLFSILEQNGVIRSEKIIFVD